jgi:hypothetical protein
MTNYTTDTDLEAYEPTVLNHLPDTTPTTTSFDDQHAEAKRVIDEIVLRHLPDELRDAVRAGETTLEDILDETDLKTVSIFYTLFMIFNWISSRRGDIYWHKARTYRALFQEAMGALSVDVSTDTVASTFEGEIRLGDVSVERE